MENPADSRGYHSKRFFLDPEAPFFYDTNAKKNREMQITNSRR
jgi:hypothetical protein